MNENEPMTLGDWMLTLFLLAIPFVNFVLVLVWAFGGGGKASRKTFCQAYLLWMLIIFFVGIAFILLAGGLAALGQG